MIFTVMLMINMKMKAMTSTSTRAKSSSSLLQQSGPAVSGASADIMHVIRATWEIAISEAFESLGLVKSPTLIGEEGF